MDEPIEHVALGDGSRPDKSAGQLMKEITEDLSTLVRKEIELAKAEVGRSIADKVTGAAVIAVAGLLGFFALIFLLLAVRDGLAEWLQPWAADLATAGILVLAGVAGALFAKRKLATPIATELTVKTIKDDVEWAKNIAKR